MVNKKKQSFEKNIVILICFFFFSVQEKYITDLAELLKTYKIKLHKNTKHVKKIFMKEKKHQLNFISKANFIGIGLQEISDEQLKDLLLLFSTKNTKYMPFSIFIKKEF